MSAWEQCCKKPLIEKTRKQSPPKRRAFCFDVEGQILAVQAEKTELFFASGIFDRLFSVNSFPGLGKKDWKKAEEALKWLHDAQQESEITNSALRDHAGIESKK